MSSRIPLLLVMVRHKTLWTEVRFLSWTGFWTPLGHRGQSAILVLYSVLAVFILREGVVTVINQASSRGNRCRVANSLGRECILLRNSRGSSKRARLGIKGRSPNRQHSLSEQP